MLQLLIPERELFNESTNTFLYIKPQVLTLEHSLVSISKWESKWKKPFFGKEDKTLQETIDYVRCMTISQNVDPSVYMAIGDNEIIQIKNYIEDSMTATWFSDSGQTKKSNEIITSEIIYCWMIQNNIPMECQKWHLNRLLTLIRVCSIKNSPPEKKSRQQILAENAKLNAERKKRLGTTG